MTRAGENNDMFTNTCSIEIGDTESEVITEQVETSLTNMEYGEKNTRHVEEIDKWVESLKRILEDVPSYMCSRGHPGRISRIPENLREVHVKGYEPYVLSIGPYHNGKPKLQHMEMRKKLVLKCVLYNNPELTLKDYLKIIISIEPRARSFYSEVEMESENFVRMLLLDSLYILTAFFGMATRPERMNILSTTESRLENDNVDVEGRWVNEENFQMLVKTDETSYGMINGENWFWALLPHDLFLIENQIPLFVLEEVYKLAYGGSEIQFMNIMKHEVSNMLSEYTKQDPKTVVFGTEEVHHLLHLGHMFFHPTILQEFTGGRFLESTQMFRLGSAVELYHAGVHFEARYGSTNFNLLDITFDGSGKLAMPSLQVDDNTESLLRNLIALEQMKYPSLGLNVSAYIVFLLHLITVPKDVELLRRKGIIQHHLASDKEMVYLVNRLSMGLAFDYVEDEYSLKYVFHELKRCSECRVPRWRAWLKHRHFRNPWTAVSLLVGFIFLLLTVLQTYYTVYSYYYPNFNGH